MKSHFRFTKGQRNGIFTLLVLIIGLQCILYVVDFDSPLAIEESEELNIFKAELDSLRHLALNEKQPKIFPFNPNFITDYKGYTLGMTNEEIDRLHAYRAQNKFVNSSHEFQNITKVSDSLLEVISPYFKFPDWVTNTQRNNINSKFSSNSLTHDEKIDLNLATASQLQRINGIGKVLSERIIKFRNKLPGGFMADVQLIDVYGLSPEVIERITNDFTVKTPPQFVKFDLNSATVEQLVTIQHIDYELANEIVDQRTLREGFKSFEELTKVKGFPKDKIEIIKLYLTL